jgi:NNP family nitrate/nitrite transporter-like MFS transporter
MGTATVPARRDSRWIDDWDPEDQEFWESRGRSIARRNLWTSIFAEHLGFSVWTMWSVLVLFMVPANGFSATPDQKFLLVSMVTLVGALLRFPYTLAVPRFGGRNWTVFSVLVLTVPATLAAVVMNNPTAPFWMFLLVAAVAGLGGGNFSSSMTNINSFYPEREKGWALGLNAGGGNIGVPAVQLIGLLVIASVGISHPGYVPMLYVPLLLVAAYLAWSRMNNLSGARADAKAQLSVLRDRNSWVMSFLYIGTFGSFIGYSFAFGLVLQVQFARTPLQAASITFIGPLLGSLIRPVGGALSDRFGGARVTMVSFAGMAAGTLAIVVMADQQSFPVFVGCFAVLFLLSGVGNGSTYKMIPAIFAAKAVEEMADGAEPAQARAHARRRAGALIGIAGAVGALGGVLINLTFREAYRSSGSAVPAFMAFLAFYAVCMGVTYLVYLRRRPAELPTLGYARV